VRTKNAAHGQNRLKSADFEKRNIPLKSTSRTKAHSKFVKNHPSLQRNTMGRADKSA
jgi:hypothetical protein